MIIYQAHNDDWVRDFRLTFRIFRPDTKVLTLINSYRTGFEERVIDESSSYLNYNNTDLIYKG